MVTGPCKRMIQLDLVRRVLVNRSTRRLDNIESPPGRVARIWRVRSQSAITMSPGSIILGVIIGVGVVGLTPLLSIRKLRKKAFSVSTKAVHHSKVLYHPCFHRIDRRSEVMSSPVSRKALLTALLDFDIPISKVEVQEVTVPAGVKAPLHLHPCPTVGLITQGTISFQIEGQAVQKLNTGDAFYEPANVRVAKFDNDGVEPATFAAFYLLGNGETETIRILEN